MASTNGSGNGVVAGAERAGEAQTTAGALPERARARAAPALPLVRRTGRADEAHLRARLELARVLGDRDEEREAGRKLAERLASRDVEIDAAVELATRTLGVADDPELRHALAEWLEGLGEPGLAASELRKLQ